MEIADPPKACGRPYSASVLNPNPTANQAAMENTTHASTTQGWRRKCFAATTHRSQRYSTWSKGTGDLPLWRRYLRQDLRSQIVRDVPNVGALNENQLAQNIT